MDYYNLECLECFKKTCYRTLRKYLLNSFDRNILESYFDLGDAEDSLECRCGYPIEDGELYISEDRFWEYSLRLIHQQLSSRIEYCSHCQGQYMGDMLDKQWKYAENPDEEVSKIREAYELGIEIKGLFELPVGSYKIENEIIRHLTCQNCGYGYNPDAPKGASMTCFEPEDKAYSSSDIEDFDRLIDFKRINSFAENYGITLSAKELEDFVSYLNEYPMLAYKHEVGIKIYDMLSQHYEASDGEVLIERNSFYRGRTCSKGMVDYSANQMWEPPKEVASHGRYNMVGTTVLYCTNNINYIPYEIHPNNHQKICIAKIQVKRPLKIFNIHRLFNKFQGFIGEVVSQDGLYNPNYALTNFIAECARQIGFKGVQYNGVNGGDYKNYAFFNFEKGKDLEITEVTSSNYKITYQINQNLEAVL
ncbi:hypothetical protein BKK42_01410 [Bacillus cereus]|nr:hypothetical protein BKK43_27410 [Bacillus cereus]ONG87907.1 hypothetical protein BKK42_01410 [Bacillus cereus]